ncbi:hypothetical protein ACFWU3_34165 [Streptomyces sp. NPDC058685]|uniref:hypothetical protein n=1 Tax=Streptomyces sp. NPDC058685 TaxID=3346598 RepID=UPI00364D4B74
MSVELATTHRGRPTTDIPPRCAGPPTLLGFTSADLQEQATAISSGKPYELRVALT